MAGVMVPKIVLALRLQGANVRSGRGRAWGPQGQVGCMHQGFKVRLGKSLRSRCPEVQQRLQQSESFSMNGEW